MVKPGQIMRRVFDSVLDAGTNTQRLRGATDNVSIHLGDVNRRTDGIDVFDGSPDVPHRPRPGETSGPVVFYDPKGGATPDQQAQIQAYVNGSNDALRDGYLAPNGRVSTTGQLRQDASAAAAAERVNGVYNGHAGHVPDTTWTGQPNPHSWLDLDPAINQSLGGQSRRYPIGYQPTGFHYGGAYPS